MTDRIDGLGVLVSLGLIGAVLELVRRRKLNEEYSLLWVGCGTEDTLFNSNKEFAQLLATSGVKHTFRAIPGAHTWIVWRRFLNEVAPQMFGSGQGLTN